MTSKEDLYKISYELQKCKDEIEDKYSEGKVPVRYNTHIDHLLKMLTAIILCIQNFSDRRGQVDKNQQIRFVKNVVRPTLIILKVIEYKLKELGAENSNLDETGIEGLIVDICRRGKIIANAMVVIVDDDNDDQLESKIGTTIPCRYNTETLEQEDVELTRVSPIIVVKKSISNDLNRWALVSHEIGHISSYQLAENYISTKHSNYPKELICDLFAADMLGHAYLKAITSFCNPENAFKSKQRHPMWYHRIEVIDYYLKSITKEITVERDIYAKLLGEVRTAWNNKLSVYGVKKPSGYEVFINAGEYQREAIQQYESLNKTKNIKELQRKIWENIFPLDEKKIDTLSPVEILIGSVVSRYLKMRFDKKEAKKRIIKWSKEQF